MIPCTACRMPLSGRSPEVLICAEREDGHNVVFGYCCAREVMPELFNQWQSWVRRHYGSPYPGAGPGVTVPWVSPKIIQSGGDK